MDTTIHTITIAYGTLNLTDKMAQVVYILFYFSSFTHFMSILFLLGKVNYSKKPGVHSVTNYSIVRAYIIYRKPGLKKDMLSNEVNFIKKNSGGGNEACYLPLIACFCNKSL